MVFSQAFGTFFSGALKTLYNKNNVRDLTMKDNVLFGMLPKFTGFGGSTMPVVALYKHVQSRNPVFATAQTLADAGESVASFALTRKSDYAVYQLEQEGIEATRGDTMSFLNLLKTRVDGAMQTLANAVETFAHRSGQGWLGQIGAVAANGATATYGDVTLLQPQEVVNFEIGMILVAGTAAQGQTLRSDEASGTIVGISSAGVLTLASIYADGGSTDWAANDYLFISGDQPTSTTHASYSKMTGLDGWLPTTAPSAAESFFGVDRSLSNRLYGQIVTGTGMPLEEALIIGQSQAARDGGSPSVALMHNAQYRRLVIELGAKKQYAQVNARTPEGVSANIGYRAILVDGDAGPIKVVSDRRELATKCHVINPDDLLLATLGEAVRVIDEDGLQMLRLASLDGVEGRLVFRGNLAVKSPGHQAAITLDTP